MSRPVLVVRPEPGATRTATRLAAMGCAPIVYPLFHVEAMAWQAPDPATFDAILLTSANAARFGGAGLADLTHLPAYAVGEATAAAARAAGFTMVTVGGGDAATTLPMIAADGHRHVLHLAGKVVRPYDALGLIVTRLPVYRTVPGGDAPGLAAALPEQGALSVLVHSPRAGERLALLMTDRGKARSTLLAISDAAATAAGTGWRAIVIAERPEEDALLARLQSLE